MGWMAVGMGRLIGLETKTAVDAEDAEGMEVFFSGAGRFGNPLPFADGSAEVLPFVGCTGFDFLFASASSAASGFFSFFFFLSSRAIASASHGAFNLPPPAGRLRHSLEPASPALSSMLRLLSTDSSKSTASYPSTT